MTAGLVVLRFSHDLRPDGIEMDLSYQLAQIRSINEHDMIRHQAIGIKEEWQSAFLDFEERKEFVIVVRPVEDHAPVMASRNHVV